MEDFYCLKKKGGNWALKTKLKKTSAHLEMFAINNKKIKLNLL
jgi:hypothetical protein